MIALGRVLALYVLALVLLIATGCASLERSSDPAPDASVSEPDAPAATPDAPPKEECPPKDPPCQCDGECPTGEECRWGSCVERCECDEDCRSPWDDRDERSDEGYDGRSDESPKTCRWGVCR